MLCTLNLATQDDVRINVVVICSTAHPDEMRKCLCEWFGRFYRVDVRMGRSKKIEVVENGT